MNTFTKDLQNGQEIGERRLLEKLIEIYGKDNVAHVVTKGDTPLHDSWIESPELQHAGVDAIAFQEISEELKKQIGITERCFIALEQCDAKVRRHDPEGFYPSPYFELSMGSPPTIDYDFLGIPMSDGSYVLEDKVVTTSTESVIAEKELALLMHTPLCTRTTLVGVTESEEVIEDTYKQTFAVIEQGEVSGIQTLPHFFFGGKGSFGEQYSPKITITEFFVIYNTKENTVEDEFFIPVRDLIEILNRGGFRDCFMVRKNMKLQLVTEEGIKILADKNKLPANDPERRPWTYAGILYKNDKRDQGVDFAIPKARIDQELKKERTGKIKGSFLRNGRAIFLVDKVKLKKVNVTISSGNKKSPATLLVDVGHDRGIFIGGVVPKTIVPT